MNVLAIDTATNALYISHHEADSSGARCITQSIITVDRKDDRWMRSATGEFLQKTGTKFADYSTFAIGGGPGSFTGLRIGFAFIKTIAQLLARPVVTFSSAELWESGFINEDENGSGKGKNCEFLFQINKTLYSSTKSPQGGPKTLEQWFTAAPGLVKNLTIFNGLYPIEFPETNGSNSNQNIKIENKHPKSVNLPKSIDWEKYGSTENYFSMVTRATPDYGHDLQPGVRKKESF